jgi:hypothetical protein
VEISPEVETWYVTLKSKDKGMADRAFDRLAEQGPLCGCLMPGRSAAAYASCGSPCEGTTRRVTYYIDVQRGSLR